MTRGFDFYSDFQVVELNPEIASLGSSFEEAAQLQRDHREVLARLQSKQSPVEDLLRQADDLIAKEGNTTDRHVHYHKL